MAGIGGVFFDAVETVTSDGSVGGGTTTLISSFSLLVMKFFIASSLLTVRCRATSAFTLDSSIGLFLLMWLEAVMMMTVTAISSPRPIPRRLEGW
ncbi:hypothetical protein [Candidatus Fukatsuia symbiotica]|uniref:hypothetical protein n=1 Tax=Candidatus Fukatsuia symbiotica TaxID=1878942 RepID=UPI0013C3604F|nr:hypothetical protein [Candidatus Fukatsuia symbiotica]